VPIRQGAFSFWEPEGRAGLRKSRFGPFRYFSWPRRRSGGLLAPKFDRSSLLLPPPSSSSHHKTRKERGTEKRGGGEMTWIVCFSAVVLTEIPVRHLRKMETFSQTAPRIVLFQQDPLIQSANLLVFEDSASCGINWLDSLDRLLFPILPSP
jgi:hypothetical protein